MHNLKKRSSVKKMKVKATKMLLLSLFLFVFSFSNIVVSLPVKHYKGPSGDYLSWDLPGNGTILKGILDGEKVWLYYVDDGVYWFDPWENNFIPGKTKMLLELNQILSEIANKKLYNYTNEILQANIYELVGGKLVNSIDVKPNSVYSIETNNNNIFYYLQVIYNNQIINQTMFINNHFSPLLNNGGK